MSQLEGAEITTGYYSISLKQGSACEANYGRRRYDFQEGSLISSMPGERMTFSMKDEGDDMEGWMLCFHPDILRGTVLGGQMDQYTFLTYKAVEALHLSQMEKDTITGVVSVIETESKMNLDSFSHKLLLSNLETLMNYCGRYYGRQFVTRTTINTDTLTLFRQALNQRFSQEELEVKGIPTVGEFAEGFGYSTYYLSDLLKKETGKGTQEYIHEKIIDKAKDLLLGTDNRVADVAYLLGYEYPEHFSKFFKSKTGMSPLNYRKAAHQ